MLYCIDFICTLSSVLRFHSFLCYRLRKLEREAKRRQRLERKTKSGKRSENAQGTDADTNANKSATTTRGQLDGASLLLQDSKISQPSVGAGNERMTFFSLNAASQPKGFLSELDTTTEEGGSIFDRKFN